MTLTHFTWYTRAYACSIYMTVHCLIVLVFVQGYVQVLPAKCMFVQVHVQGHPFPQVCLQTMLGERAGTMFETVWDNFGINLGAFWTIGRQLGTFLGQLGTIFETSFPRFCQRVDFRRFFHESITPWAPLFHPWETLFPCLGCRRLDISVCCYNLG